MRTCLTNSIDVYVDEQNGVDGNGLGSQSAPCQSQQYVWDTLAGEYDLAGHSVTVHLACKGPNTPSFTRGLQAYGLLVGQSTPGQVSFIGDVNDPRNCLIKLSAGNVLAMSFNSMLVMAGIKGDTFDTHGSDIMSVADGSHLILGRIGDPWSIVWGDTINPANHISIAGARVYTAAPDAIEVTPAFDVTVAAAVPKGSSMIPITDGSNIIPNLGVWGPSSPSSAMPGQVVAVECINNVLRLNNFSTRALSAGEKLYLSKSANAHISISQFGKFAYENNVGQPPWYGPITGDPYFYEGLYQLVDIGEADLGLIWQGNAHGPKFHVGPLCMINTGKLPMAGSYPGIIEPGGYVT